MPHSALTGGANLLVMPNIDAANIAYNLLKTAAGGNIAIGPVLLGAATDFMDDASRLQFRGEAPSAPWAYMGAYITDPTVVDGEPLEPFSMTRVWRKLATEGLLHGAPLGGYWMHVGDPQARDQAEARLAAAAARA